MCSILISIKPKYVDKIFNGSKKFEYRTKLAKKDEDKLIVYCTSPVQRVIGEVDVVETLAYSPETLWNKTHKYSGITKAEYDRYFLDHQNACAYVLGNVKKYSQPKVLEDFGLHVAPQTFYYL